MSATHRMNLEVRLSAASPDAWVDVRLRSYGERWVGVAEIGGRHHIGLGPTARQALTAALASLGDHARALLLADPALLAPSCALTTQIGRT